MHAGVEHERDQHGTVGRRDRDTVPASTATSIFDVVADLKTLGSSNNGFRARQDLIAGDLLRCGAILGRKVERADRHWRRDGRSEHSKHGPARAPGDADELGNGGVARSGLGGDRDVALVARGRDPASRSAGPGRARRGGFAAASVAGGEEGGWRPPAGAHRRYRPRARRRRRSRQAGLEAEEQERNVVACRKRRHFGGIERLHRQILERTGQGHVAVELDEPLRQPRLFGVVDQSWRRFGCLISLACCQQVFEIAIGDDELGGGLGTDPRHAGHIVDAVADQRLDFDHLIGADTEFLAHLVRRRSASA